MEGQGGGLSTHMLYWPLRTLHMPCATPPMSHPHSRCYIVPSPDLLSSVGGDVCSVQKVKSFEERRIVSRRTLRR